MDVNSLLEEDGSLSDKMGPILRDYKNEQWVKDIYLHPGKTVTQKIYNTIHNITELPKCPVCQKNVKPFISFTEGYADTCKLCSKKSGKVVMGMDYSADIADEVSEGNPVVLTKEEDLESKTVESSILTCLSGNASESQILKEHGLDPEVWKITRIRHSIWQQNSKKNGTKNLYASKITASPRGVSDMSEDHLRKLLDKLIPYKPKKIPFSFEKTNKTVVIPIADFHLGLLAPGARGYNMDIAEERLQEFLATVSYKVGCIRHNVDNVILTLGNDFFNADNLAGTTTKGTPQDQECNYFDIFDRGVKIALDAVAAVETMFPEATIRVYNVQSNHDKISSYTLMRCVHSKYADSKRVVVDCNSGKMPRFYVRVANNLFGFAHETKVNDCARLMSVESPVFWSQATHKTFFIAHLHHEEVQEIGGVQIRRLPILSSASRWTVEQGYVGTVPRAQAFVFDNMKGLEDIINVVVD